MNWWKFLSIIFLRPGGRCYHAFVFKHPEAAPSIVRDGKSTAFVESRFCFFYRFRFFRVCCVFGLLIVTVAVNGPYGLCSEAVEWSIDVFEICVVRDSLYVAS